MQPLQELPTPPPPTPTLPPVGSPVADATATPVADVTATPLPAPTAPVPAPTVPVSTTPTAQVQDWEPVNLAAMMALFIYLVFFGVLGYRRGSLRELTVFIVAVSASFLLQQFSETIVTLFDRIGKGMAFIAGQPVPEQSSLGAWATANTATLLTTLWLITMVTTYLLTARFVRESKSDGWAVILGVLNGLMLASIFAPLLTALIFPNVTMEGPIVQMPVLGLLANLLQQLIGLAQRIWDIIAPVGTNVFFLGVIVLILLAALTLRTNARSKS